MSLDTRPIRPALLDHALTTGHFERVSGHEPKAPPPGGGLNAALWAQRVRPVPASSGLRATTGVAVFMLRIYMNMIAEPQDDIDPTVDAARDSYMTAVSADFTLGGLIKQVDLLGATGFAFEATAGYLPLGNTMQRVVDIQTPCVINDCWPQTP